MAAPATMGTGPEPDQPEAYLDEGPEYEEARYGDAEFQGLDYQEPEYEGPDYEHRYPRRRMGWFGILVLTVASLAVVAAVYALVHHAVKPKIKLSYQPAAIFSLQVGQCFNGQNSTGVTVLPCSSPHEAEVFATFRLPHETWPGDGAVASAAQTGCEQQIAGYMNPQFTVSTLSQQYIYPNRMTWAAGVRTVVCDVRSDNGLVTGSVRQEGIPPDGAGSPQAAP